MTEPLFLKPVFHEKIWGGRRLAEDFNYDIPDGTIGECWAISGHPHGPNVIENGEFKGQLLPDVYANHPEVFGNPKSKVFPLLTKILDAEASLSVQVHPDNAYAEEHEHELGKTECWYVIHADEGAYLTYGHTAKTREELKEMINNHEWQKLFDKKPVTLFTFHQALSTPLIRESLSLKLNKVRTLLIAFMIMIELTKRLARNVIYT